MKVSKMAVHEDDLSRSQGPNGGLRPNSVNRHVCITCTVRQVLIVNQVGHDYEPTWTLYAAGRQPVYIKGRPGGG